mgnify:CR=1 FL=1
MARRRRTCFWCDEPMFLDGDRWVCSHCAWTMPNREICPRCWAPLPEEEGPGGEKVCPDCGYELWPPRDADPPPKEVWYCPPGGQPYKVVGPDPLPLVPVPRKGGGRSRRSKRKSPLQQRLEEWRRKNPMSRRIVGP